MSATLTSTASSTAALSMASSSSSSSSFISGAVAGSLLSGEAASVAMRAVGRGDKEKALALFALTAPDANSRPLFHSVLFCEAIDGWQFDMADAMLDQSLPFRTSVDLGQSLLQAVRACDPRHRPAEALPIVDRLLDAMRALGKEECAYFASGHHFRSLLSTAQSSAPPFDYLSDEDVDEEGCLVPIIPKRKKYSARRSLLAFQKEFNPFDKLRED